MTEKTVDNVNVPSYPRDSRENSLVQGRQSFIAISSVPGAFSHSVAYNLFRTMIHIVLSCCPAVIHIRPSFSLLPVTGFMGNGYKEIAVTCDDLKCT